MSALFGFLGPPSPELRQHLAGILQHRGEECRWIETRWGSIGTRVDLRDDAATALLGQHGSNAVGLAGHVLGDAPVTDVPQRPPWRGAWVAASLGPEGLVLARDGAGARSIYWGRLKDRVIFGSEPKAVSAAPGFDRRLRLGGLAQYLAFSFIPVDETIIEGVFAVGPGERVHCTADTMSKRRWFVYEENPERTLTDGEWVEEFRSVHAEAIRERLVGSAPLAFLSGGIDSSIVAAELRAQGVDPLDALTVHFGEGYPNELEFSREVSKRLGVRAHEFLVNPDSFVQRLEKLVWHLDDPIGDPVTMPNFELAREARRFGRHVFNGEGGDPLFGGPKNLTMMMHHVYGGVPRPKGFRERAYLSSYRRAYSELPYLLTAEALEQINPEQDLESVLTPFFEDDRSMLHKLLLINARLKGARLILPKVERMLGAWGLVPMSPLFDERIMRLSQQMPERLKLSAGMEKVVLKKAYANNLPESVVARPKSGMRVPVHFWFAGEMQTLARDVLSERIVKSQGLFRYERIQQLLDYDIEEGPGRYGLRLWMLMTFQLWRQTLLDAPASARLTA